MTAYLHEHPSVVLLMEGTVQLQGVGGESEFRMAEPGRWFSSSGADHLHTLTVAGTAHLICIETR